MNKSILILLFLLSLLPSFAQQPANFMFTPTDLSGVFQGQAKINGVPAEAGDWIAAFDETGICCGAAEVIINGGDAFINFPIYGNDPQTTPDEGVNNNPIENFFLQLYDASTGIYLDFPDSNNPTAFGNWHNTNGAPMSPDYDDPFVMYNFIAPTVVAQINPSDTTICEGTSLPLTASGGTTYQWDNSVPGLNNYNIANPVATPTTTQTYRVTVSDGGDMDVAQITITVNPSPTAHAGMDTSVCEGFAVQLNATGGTDCAWDNGTSLTNDEICDPFAFPMITTTYTVTVTGANNCTATDDVVVTVNPNPIVDAGPDTTICLGDCVQLNALGGMDYEWLNPGGLSADNIANPMACPTETITYQVIIGDQDGCAEIDEITVTVIDNSSVSAGADQSICQGGFAQLQASGGTSYQWDTNVPGLNDYTIANPIASPMSSQTYFVTITAGNCAIKDTVEVTVTGSITADTGPDQTICEGSTAQLQIMGGTAYQWDTNVAGLNDYTIANPIASPTTTQTYYITITDGMCSKVDSVSINVEPSITADAGTDISICDGTSTPLQASGGTNYQWDTNAPGLDNYTTANPMASPTMTTTYTVTVTNSGACSSVDQVTVTVDPAPTVDAGMDFTICSGSSIPLSATGTNTVSYAWDMSAAGLDNYMVANPTASPTTTTTYTVTATSANNCTATNQVTITVMSCGISFDLKVWLSGPYASSGMSTLLNSAVPNNQPYNAFPWFYGGGETASSLPTNIVDWILVELRDAGNINTVVTSRAVLLASNGMAVDPMTLQEGIELPNTHDGQSYYITVRHRNHLAIVSSTPITITDGGLADLTTPSIIMGGTDQVISVGSGGAFGLRAGDIDANGVINVHDFNDFLSEQSQSGYRRSDCNLNTTVGADDFNTYNFNASSIGVNVIRY